MVVHKRKKVTKYRGSKTHGWGAMKKHRGAGNRGGRGMAGTGKHGDAKKPSIWKTPYFGKRGFHNPNPKKNKDIKEITLKDVEEKLAFWKKKGFVKEENGVSVIDLAKIGFTKLLSNGKATKKLKLIIKYASKGAIERVQKAGGEVLTAKKEKVKEKPKEAPKK